MHIQISNQEKPELDFEGYSCNWDTCICGFDEVEKGRDEIIFGFLHEGAIKNDKQLACSGGKTKDDFIVGYRTQYPECNHHMQDANFY